MYFADFPRSENCYDAVLIGAGIMSATLGVLLKELDPDIRILIVERLDSPALESSAAVNNAGTGHAANCELNYTPLKDDGTISIEKALEINSSFEQSLEFWASLVEKGKLTSQVFLNKVPHISFVWGDSDIAFLQQRYQKLSVCEPFSSMQWSMDKQELMEWIPLVMDGRNMYEQVAATKIDRGTDIDFGALTSSYLKSLRMSGAVELQLSSEVVDLNKNGSDMWRIELQDSFGGRSVYSSFVFLGAGGGSLPLLQKSGIPESKDYGGFPVSGQWLVCNNEEMIDRHNSKVYGKAKLGAPPMSVPHLDRRWINGRRSLLFGPFAGFSTKFLKSGSTLDLFGSVNKFNLNAMLQVGAKNLDLVKYLIGQIRMKEDDRIQFLKEFLPKARQQDWNLSVAGQRVQIIKRTKKGGILKMGTEVVASSDGSLAALLGASPGASTAVTIMLKVLDLCWSKRMESDSWRTRLASLLPSLSKDLENDNIAILQLRKRSNSLLNLN